MYTIEIKKTYTETEVKNRFPADNYINDNYARIRQMIFEEMIMQQLPMKITLDIGEETIEIKKIQT